jgi:hypothetical protein
MACCGVAARHSRPRCVRPGRFEISNVRLRHRLNGGLERVGEGIGVV